MLEKLFLDHPRSVDESYLEHMGQAFSFAGRMMLGGVACFIHGLLPCLFVRTGSQAVTELHGRMVVNRRRHARRHGADERTAMTAFDYVI